MVIFLAQGCKDIQAIELQSQTDFKGRFLFNTQSISLHTHCGIRMLPRLPLAKATAISCRCLRSILPLASISTSIRAFYKSQIQAAIKPHAIQMRDFTIR